jgi:hypothetical protein
MNHYYFVLFEVITAVAMKNAVYWDVPPCISCVIQRFGKTYRLQLQGRKIRERNKREQMAADCSSLHFRRRHFFIIIILSEWSLRHASLAEMALLISYIIRV